MNRRLATIGLVSSLAAHAVAVPVDTAWTYQGVLRDGGEPANGVYDLLFQQYDSVALGLPVGQTLFFEDVNVTDGLITVELDFGNAPYINGLPRYLEVRVRPGVSVDPHTALVPRTLITATPYSIESDSSLDDAYRSGDTIDTQPGSPVLIDGLGGLDLTGDLAVGGPGNTADVRLFRTNGVLGAELRDSAGSGHLLNLNDGLGNQFFSVAPDASLANPATGGAFLLAWRSNADTGLFFDGNAGGTGQPVFFVGGDSQTLTLDAREIGDTALEVPAGSVSAFEILDEPGLSTRTEAGATVVPTFNFFPPNLWAEVNSKSIVTPAPGKILAIASANVTIGLLGDPRATAWIHLTTDGGFAFVPDVELTARTGPDLLQSNSGTTIEAGQWRDAVTTHRVFDAPTAGVYMVRLMGAATGVNNATTVVTNTVTLVYIPSDYSLGIPTLIDGLAAEQDELKERLDRQQRLIENLLEQQGGAGGR